MAFGLLPFPLHETMEVGVRWLGRSRVMKQYFALYQAAYALLCRLTAEALVVYANAQVSRKQLELECRISSEDEFSHSSTIFTTVTAGREERGMRSVSERERTGKRKEKALE